MDRETLIVDTFVEMAAAVAGHLDPLDFLHTLCRRCVHLLDCDEAGVLVSDGEGQLQVMGCSSERTEALELLQSHGTAGPCRESILTGQAVTSVDLHDDLERWPAFSRAAVDYGFRAIRTLPMRVHEQTIGALNLFRLAPGRIAERDLDLAGALADVAAVALLHDRAQRESDSVAEQLRYALSSRVAIEQAKGILAERRRIGVDEAFGLLRAYARPRNLRLRDVAEQLVGGELDADDLPETLPA